ncbi:MAG: helix-turn-helix transcriptional regulator [Deltaproteobacteria bacterium]|nr:helix-turn-helix transcriptional regulator [Deltaproteobacteria bacterium]
MAKTKNALEILKRRRAKDLATLIRKTREEAGLTQEGLAQKIETTQSVISRLEDADYEGHSLTMLDKIARVLNMRLNIDMDSKQSESSRAPYMEILTVPNVHVYREAASFSDTKLPNIGITVRKAYAG